MIRLSRGRELPKKAKSEAEEAFARAWRGEPFVREYQFHGERGWRLDFAWPERLVALEVEGWGRHQQREGYRKDCEKYSEAAILGWRVLRVVAWEMHQVEQWISLAERALRDIVGG